jgi:hypothetical protein
MSETTRVAELESELAACQARVGRLFELMAEACQEAGLPVTAAAARREVDPAAEARPRKLRLVPAAPGGQERGEDAPAVLRLVREIEAS